MLPVASKCNTKFLFKFNKQRKNSIWRSVYSDIYTKGKMLNDCM